MRTLTTTLVGSALSHLRAAWRGTPLGCGPQLRRAAQVIPLVHVTKHSMRRPFPDLLLTPPHELSVTTPRPDSGATPVTETWTQMAERKLGLGPNLYFYAGRAMPEYGEVALAFSPQCSESHTGSANNFDSGNLAHGRLVAALPDDRDETLRRFTRDTLVPLNRWRAGFRRHLAVNFSAPTDYFDGKPCTPGPAELFRRNDDNCMAWMFEVRFKEPESVFNVVKWSGPPDLKPRLRAARKRLPPSSPVRQRLKHFLQRDIISADGGRTVRSLRKGSAHGCERIEQWVRETAGI